MPEDFRLVAVVVPQIVLSIPGSIRLVDLSSQVFLYFGSDLVCLPILLLSLFGNWGLEEKKESGGAVVGLPARQVTVPFILLLEKR